MRGTANTGLTVAVSGNTPAGATLLNKFFSQKRLDSLKKHDYAYLTGNYYEDRRADNTMLADNYSVRNYGSASFVTDNPSKNISASELANLCHAMYSETKNIVIITPTVPDASSENGKRIIQIMKNGVYMGKNVFVFPELIKAELKLMIPYAILP